MKPKSTHFKRQITKSFFVGLLLTAFCFVTTQTQAQTCRALFQHFVSNNTVYLSDSSWGSNLNYLWHFGNGHQSTVKNPTHNYTANGSYNVCLYIYDSVLNCKDSICQTIVINYTACNTKFTFFDSSHGYIIFFPDGTGNSSSATYKWYFGDGDSSTDQYAVHKYAHEGVFNVCLKVEDGNCSKISCQKVFLGNCATDFNFTTSSGRNVNFWIDSSTNIKSFWDFGDGQTDTGGKVNHNFIANGEYLVTLTAINGTCTSITKKYVNIHYVEPTYTVYGSITAGSDTLLTGKVYLIFYDLADSSLMAIDSFLFTANTSAARFYFRDLKAGTYYLKAALDSSDSNYSDYLPTYYDTVLNWSNALPITFSNQQYYYANIHLVKGTNTGGPAFIGGKVYEGANKQGDPLGGIQIMLFNSNNRPIAHTYSKHDGSFSFSNLAYGTYRVYAEVIGLEAIAGTVILSEENPSVEDVEIQIGTESAVTGIYRKWNEVSAELLSVYPNPATNVLNIKFKALNNEQLFVQLLDITGKQMMQQNINVYAGSSEVILNINNLPKGMYFIRLQSANTKAGYNGRFIKQ